jgi:single-strand DNA-binding protein
MPKSLNKVMIIGNLGQDPEGQYTPSGKLVVKFTVATNESFTNNAGERVDRTEWHNVEAWGRLAEICQQYLTKGQKVYIEGQIRTDNWEGDDGIRRYFTKINARELIMLGNSNGNGQPRQEQAQQPQEEIPW